MIVKMSKFLSLPNEIILNVLGEYLNTTTYDNHEFTEIDNVYVPIRALCWKITKLLKKKVFVKINNQKKDVYSIDFLRFSKTFIPIRSVTFCLPTELLIEYAIYYPEGYMGYGITRYDEDEIVSENCNSTRHIYRLDDPDDTKRYRMICDKLYNSLSKKTKMWCQQFLRLQTKNLFYFVLNLNTGKNNTASPTQSVKKL